MLKRGLLICLLAAGAAGAQGMRDGDETMDAAGVQARLSGKSVLFYDGSEARYSANGDYTYRYTPQDPAFGGTYEATDDSQVCVTFANGSSRCDTYVVNGERLVLITKDGLRFPVKALTALD